MIPNGYDIKYIFKNHRDSTSTSLVLKAMEQAIDTKVNVIVLPEIQQLGTK